MRLFRLSVLGLLCGFLFGMQPADAGMHDLKSQVEAELDRYYIFASPIDVKVTSPGIVTLEGTADSFWEKREIFDSVSRVDRVLVLKDKISVDTIILPDAVIKDNIRDDLARTQGIIAPDEIQISVRNGVVILSGTVTYANEDDVAFDIASWQRGVKDVVNNLQVLPPQKTFTDKTLTEAANSVVDRFFPLEKDHVRVDVERGRAVLDGKVNTLWAKRNIAEEVEELLGVIEVENNLAIVQ